MVSPDELNHTVDADRLVRRLVKLSGGILTGILATLQGMFAE